MDKHKRCAQQIVPHMRSNIRGTEYSVSGTDYKSNVPFSRLILNIFNVNVSGDSTNIHPSKFCKGCFRRIANNSQVSSSAVLLNQPHDWQVHTDDGCYVCGKGARGGSRHTKRKRRGMQTGFNTIFSFTNFICSAIFICSTTCNRPWLHCTFTRESFCIQPTYDLKATEIQINHSSRYTITYSISFTDEHFMNGSDELRSDKAPDRPTIGQFTLNTMRMTMLVGEEIYRRVDLNKYQTGVVFIWTTEILCYQMDDSAIYWRQDLSPASVSLLQRTWILTVNLLFTWLIDYYVCVLFFSFCFSYTDQDGWRWWTSAPGSYFWQLPLEWELNVKGLNTVIDLGVPHLIRNHFCRRAIELAEVAYPVHLYSLCTKECINTVDLMLRWRHMPLTQNHVKERRFWNTSQHPLKVKLIATY